MGARSGTDMARLPPSLASSTGTQVPGVNAGQRSALRIPLNLLRATGFYGSILTLVIYLGARTDNEPAR